MKISIRNFRAISEADIETGLVNLIAGRNEAGKTSIAQAIAAALTGQIMPIDGLTKSHAGMLVHSGNASGEVSIDNAVGMSRVSYPDAERTTDGTPLEISTYAAGIASVFDTPKKQRGKLISEILKSDPTSADLVAELKKFKIPEPVIKKVIETVEAIGFDSAFAQSKESGARLKGQWEEVTGDRYGSAKAGSWQPPAWTPDLETETEENLTAKLKQENEWLTAAISHEAISESDRQKLQAVADTIPELESKEKAIQLTLYALFTNQTDIKKAIRETPAPIEDKVMECPCCRAKLKYLNGELLPTDDHHDNAEFSQTKTKLAELEKSLSEVDAEIRIVSADSAVIKSELKSAYSARESVSKPAEAVDTDKVEDCKKRIALAQDRLSAFQKNKKAAAYAAGIVINKEMQSILAPDGIRQRTLKSALGKLNDKLGQYSELAKWKRAEIKENMSISYGGNPFMLISQSAQFRCKVLFQLAFADLDGSRLVLIDAADVLDRPGRNGLLNLMSKMSIPSIIFMTMEKDSVPKMPESIGKSFWIENGKVEEMK